MAAGDPIVYPQLCKLFPKLTPKQATNSCLYSIGSNYQDISSLQNATPAAIKKSLESSQKYFNVESLPELKTVFWSSFVLKQIYRKYRISTDNTDALLTTDSIAVLQNIFPELDQVQTRSAVLHSVGITQEEMAIQSSSSVAHIKHSLLEAMAILGIGTLALLRTLVISRLIIDLC